MTEHAEKAFELIKKNNYDLIALDLELPDVHGIEFLEILKQEEQYFDILVLVISGTTDSKVIREVYKKEVEVILLENLLFLKNLF